MRPNPLKSGTLSLEAEENRRVSQVLTWVSLTGALFLFGIAAISWVSGNVLHGQILIVFGITLLINNLIFTRTRSFEGQRTGVVVLVICLFAYLITTGGENNTGPLWFYAFPPMAFFLTSLKVGSILIGLCFCFAILVFRFPELPFVYTEYNTEFQIRFLATVAFETIFCFVLDLSRRHARRELINVAALYERAAKTDSLTGLPNRRALQDSMAREFSRYQRTGHHFSVVLMDLDSFKQINDTYGHDAGDAILGQFAALLRQLSRTSDMNSRWGGEEFLLLLPDTSLLQALTLAERLRQAVEAHTFAHGGQKIPLTISAGVCSITQADNTEGLLKQADKYLYEAKASGRNRVTPRVRATGDTSREDYSSGSDSSR